MGNALSKTDKVTIIAGRDNLPVQILQVCMKKNIAVSVLLMDGCANPDDYQSYDVETHTVGVGDLVGMIKIMKAGGTTHMVFAGGVNRPTLSQFRLGFSGFLFFLKAGIDGLGDDGAVRILTAFMQSKGFTVLGAHDFIQSAFDKGALGQVKPSALDKKSIARAVDVLKIMSPADVGQSIICQNGTVLGIEAIEGTDGLMKRCGALIRPHKKGKNKAGAVLVKMQKVGQSKKVDMPTIGVQTIISAHEHGLSGVAFDHRGCLLVEKEEIIAKADKLGLFLVAV